MWRCLLSSTSGSRDSTGSADLVRRAQAGERAAFDALIRRCEPRLAGLVRARMGVLLRRFEDSGDIVQSVLREAVADLPAFEYRGERSFLRWLSTLVEHKIAHRSRDLQREKRSPDRVVALPDSRGGRTLRSHEPSPSAVAAGHEIERRYHRALDALEDDERELVLLHVELGCPHDEIAAALSIVSVEAVRKRIARALARLQRSMRRGADDEQ